MRLLPVIYKFSYRLTVCEFYEQDEILKLRAAALKKEDSDLQMEMEKLEQERNLHVRELRRIHGEDTSRYVSTATRSWDITTQSFVVVVV